MQRKTLPDLNEWDEEVKILVIVCIYKIILAEQRVVSSRSVAGEGRHALSKFK